MRVAEVDRGFVPAPPDRVFELVRDPNGYPVWWPGVRAAGQGRLRFPELRSVSVATDAVREGIELLVRVEGREGRGHLQWYLEAFKEGTIVFGITDVQTRKAWSTRRVLRHRTSMRQALLAMKSRFE
jgi:uncharacterized protein YndB with AHSA1/START domain